MSLLDSLLWQTLRDSHQPLFFASLFFTAHFATRSWRRLLLPLLVAQLCVTLACYAAWIDDERDTLVLVQSTNTLVFELAKRRQGNCTVYMHRNSHGGRYVFSHTTALHNANASAYAATAEANVYTVCNGTEGTVGVSTAHVTPLQLVALHAAYSVAGALVSVCVVFIAQVPRIHLTMPLSAPASVSPPNHKWRLRGHMTQFIELCVIFCLSFWNVDGRIDATSFPIGLFQCALTLCSLSTIAYFYGYSKYTKGTSLRLDEYNAAYVHWAACMVLLFGAHALLFVVFGVHAAVATLISLATLGVLYSTAPLYCCYARGGRGRRFRVARAVLRTLESSVLIDEQRPRSK